MTVAGRAAARVQFACSACGTVAPKWQGRCAACGEWNTLVEELERPASGRPAATETVAATTSLESVVTAEAARRSTGIGELDRVLGGGVVAGALILLGGDPGIGKSTLALQLAHHLGSVAAPGLYCAGEESAAQLGLRARRLGCATGGIRVLAETDLDVVIGTITATRPAIAIIDSIQTVGDPGVPGSPGSPTQVREAVSRLLICAKTSDVPIVLVGHVTKDGAIAGPRTLEHMVDVVLFLEGERHGDHRLLRGVKNRFGSTGEIGLFAMAEHGMREVGAPGRAFLDEASLGVSGTMLTVACEGARALVVEVQALTVKTAFAVPRRTASGLDLGRLHVLLAVLERRATLSTSQCDVYVNAVGGMRLAEPAVDLAVALAVAGSARDKTLTPGCVALGEVGLGGEIRRVRRLEARLAEAAALRLDTAIIPAGYEGRLPAGLRCHRVSSIVDAIALLA